MTDDAEPARVVRTPKGAVGIYTDKSGNVIASVSDFERNGYGGFTLAEAQEFRCKDKLKAAVIDTYCSQHVSDALSSYARDTVFDCLLRAGGKATYMWIGHEP